MTILAGVVAAYLIVCLALFVFQSRLLYHPQRELVANPGNIGLAYEDVFLTTGDGVRIHGWYVPAEAERHVLLFFHGNAGNISHRLETLRIFNGLGLSVLIIDYRGYGRSDGTISERGSYADARAALDYVTGELNVPSERVIYFGRSLGSAVAIELATHQAPEALIAESVFPSVPDMARRYYPLLPVRWLARFRYDSVPRVASLACPKLFIHSRGDDVMPFALAERLVAVAAEPKTFLEIQGDHNSGFLTSGVVYVDGLARFLDTLE